jgi:hypothetical protein
MFNIQAGCLFADDLDENPFLPFSVELSIEYPLPGPEVQLATGNSDSNLPAHNGAFQMGVGVVFVSVMLVPGVGFFGRKPFEPDLKVMMQAGFVVVDKNAGGNMHGIAQQKPLRNAAFRKTLLDLRSNIDKLTPLRSLKPEFFSIAFHIFILSAGTKKGPRPASERHFSPNQANLKEEKTPPRPPFVIPLRAS